MSASRSSPNLTTTVFRVAACRRTTFLRSELNLLIEQSLTAILDGGVIEAFRFEVKYSEMRDLRYRLCQYLRKLYKNEPVPDLPEIASSSPQTAVDEALRAVECLFEFVYQRKYLVESPLYRGFMHYKKKLKVDPANNSAPGEEVVEPSSGSSTTTQQMATLTPKLVSTANVSPQDYMIEASALLIGARRNESERHYPEAYDLYKLAIQTLLEGARQDGDAANVKIVKQKIALLLDAADRIYETHLSQTAKETQPPSTNPRDTANDFAMADLRRLFHEYKIFGIDGKIVIIQEKETSKLQAVKILKKAVKDGIKSDRTCVSTIVPTDIDRMVRLASLHETETSVLLMLEYVPGGLLFSHFGLAESYPRPMAKNPTPLDPSASVLKPPHPALSAQESLRRKWSLHLSTSDWSSSFVQQRNRANSLAHMGAKEPAAIAPLDDLEEGDSVSNFQQVLTLANKTSQNKFSLLDAFSKSQIGGDSAFVEPSDDEPQIILPAPPPSSKEVEGEGASDSKNTAELRLPSIEDVRKWALQILDAFEGLHRYGFIWGDFNPNNVLFDPSDNGARLTFVCSWIGVDVNPPSEDAARHGYVAPELLGPFASGEERGFACDFWSFGAFLFNLVVGYPIGSYLGDTMQSFSNASSPSSSCYLDSEIGEIVRQHVKLPSSTAAAASSLQDLLILLLKKNSAERLTSPDKIRTHPFFNSNIGNNDANEGEIHHEESTV